ncbi:hypothetical protein BC835DRAFT_1242912, partial [Cytidiella melzeri]
MAPSNLQGLNIVHPAPTQQNPYLSDQDLLAVPPFHDLSAQLDLWTNLSFQSDEPLISKDRLASEKLDSGSADRRTHDADKYNLDEDYKNTGKIAETASHEHVVTGTVVPPSPAPSQNTTAVASTAPHLNAFDIGALLASFGMDPFHVPNSLQMPPPPATAAPTLAQLLSFASQSPSPLVIPSEPSVSSRSAGTSTSSSASSSSSASHPVAKRARTARSASVEQADAASEGPTSPDAEEKYTSSTPVTASEDKRRRNTAASARFRLKKKEREAALEKKAKEFEVRVSELEKECEALRRENGWLKGLVVG